MSAKTVAKKTGNGLLTIGNAFVTGVHDGPRKRRIVEIDQAIALLKEERAGLKRELIDSSDV